ncbi:unnamed protein product [Danaus chrysippus]|uniref:(African queen) hypothetical protein n=1 Tax=Danaus chrysippus TaxID=151541 RepID=A0A8J2W8B7_9NEOP|nr:unnamed protein product [Danaus chrysippus]
MFDEVAVAVCDDKAAVVVCAEDDAIFAISTDGAICGEDGPACDKEDSSCDKEDSACNEEDASFVDNILAAAYATFNTLVTVEVQWQTGGERCHNCYSCEYP